MDGETQKTGAFISELNGKVKEFTKHRVKIRFWMVRQLSQSSCNGFMLSVHLLYFHGL